jgi:hypothetical protein
VNNFNRRIEPMHCSPRWTTAVAAAALIALPLAAYAQTPPTSTPQTQQTMPAQPPADPKPATAQAPVTKVDAPAAKQHLSEARDSLSQLTALPEAARLQGDARTQVTQLISNFNELITTQSDWRAAYAKVDANLSALLGPDSPDQGTPASGVTGAVGTSGAGASAIDPAVRAKLVDFRTHLKAFEHAAAGEATGATAPAAATAATASPADPAPSAAPAATAATAAPAATAASAVAAGSPTSDMAPADQAKAAAQVGSSEADKHLDAISAILDSSKTGTLTKAQTAALKKHVTELRQVLQQGK